MVLYPYQETIKNTIQAGQSVIIQAPTGAGKTRAALAPFIEAFFEFPADRFPRKCIYSVPMRTLANQFQADYADLAGKYQRRFDRQINVTIQTGDRPEDPKFEGDLIFATIDQTLSSLLGVPYALSRKQANLNVGSVLSSYLIFDEYHLFPTTKTAGVGALGTTLTMLQLLAELTPFCLMTATFSETMLQTLANLLQAQVITVGEEELAQIETNNGKTPRKSRRFRVVDRSLTESVDDIINSPGQRIIAICNRVDRAQMLYEQLRQTMTATEVILLHARFLRTDRNQLEDRVMKEFGKEKQLYSPHKIVLIATQVIEVGLDVSCDEMYTEVAPANAIIQRAGRCARRPGEHGSVVIHPLPDDSSKPHLPYDQKLCDATLTAFSQPAYNGQILGFKEEQEIINQVHNETDQAMLQKLKARHEDTISEIECALMLGESGVRRDLIRSVNNVTLLVHHNPGELGNPYRCEGFSLFIGSLKGKWDTLQEWLEQTDWDYPLMYPVAIEDETDENNRQKEPRYEWKYIDHGSKIDVYTVLAIHPNFVTYGDGDQIGFQFRLSEGVFKSEPAPALHRGERAAFDYDLESYADHISKMYRIYQRDLQTPLAYVAKKLEQQLNLKPNTVDKACRLVIALHDVGKMDTRWQQWGHNYHRAIDKELADHFMVAHTHSQSDDQRELAKTIRPKRPPHAGEGASASANMLASAVRQWGNDNPGRQALFKAMLTAITRHHHAQSEGCKEYALHPAANKAIEQALTVAGLPELSVQIKPYNPQRDLSEFLLSTEQINWTAWFLYFVLVRSLIISDHQSLAEQKEKA